MKEVIFSQEELQEKLKTWQKRLRLQDWIIKVHIVRGRDMKLEECQAEVSWTIAKKTATVRIIDPLDYPSDVTDPQDMENSLIHELLHLHLAPITGGDVDGVFHIAEEQAIESITSGIISCIREGVKT